MNDTGQRSIPWDERIWLLFAFMLPLTIVSEIVLFAGLAGWAVQREWRRVPGRIRHWPFVWPMLLFLVVAAATWFWSVRPEETLGRMHRLLFPLAMVAIGTTFAPGRTPGGGSAPVLRLAAAFVAGCCLRGAYDLVRVPLEVAGGTQLFDTGNMRDPQMYMAALCLLIGFSGSRSLVGTRRPMLGVGIVFAAAGLVLHFKRGVWFAFLATMGLLGLRQKRWKLLLVLGACVLAALAVPEVRLRLRHLEMVFQSATGGRFALWTEVAPALIPDHPQGMGWSAVAHEDLAAHTEFLQPRLNHLHNNLLEVALETGWAGLAAWVAWMGSLLWIALRQSRPGTTGNDAGHALSVGVFCALLALLLNGMVEYNFGDTEILMLYALLGGIVAAQAPERGGDASAERT